MTSQVPSAEQILPMANCFANGFNSFTIICQATAGAHTKLLKSGRGSIVGVYRYDYLVLGWKLNQEIFETDWLNELQSEAADNIFFPEDERYVVYGKLVEQSDCITGFDLLEMDVNRTIMNLEEYDNLCKAFHNVTSQELDELVEHQLPKLYLFSMLQ
jgi:cyclophilin family peptidyl-prolyl cis-trans isomerase